MDSEPALFGGWGRAAHCPAWPPGLNGGRSGEMCYGTGGGCHGYVALAASSPQTWETWSPAAWVV